MGPVGIERCVSNGSCRSIVPTRTPPSGLVDRFAVTLSMAASQDRVRPQSPVQKMNANSFAFQADFTRGLYLCFVGGGHDAMLRRAGSTQRQASRLVSGLWVAVA
jgi:hypothetical protein